MKTTIEVTSVNDSRAVSELVRATYANEEPGFQVDDVVSIEQFYSVVEAIEHNMPDHNTPVHFDKAVGGLNILSQPFHSDDEEGQYEGLAIHQELWMGDTAVVLAISAQCRKFREAYISLDEASVIKVGTTKQGRLTIVSDGGYSWLLPTIHFFGRRDRLWQHTPWISYRQTGPLLRGYASGNIIRGIYEAFDILDAQNVWPTPFGGILVNR